MGNLANMSMAVIGTGNIGTAILNGIIKNKLIEPGKITCADKDEEKLQDIQVKYGVLTTTNNGEAVKNADILLMSVKPQIMASVLSEISPFVNEKQIIISVAAGLPISFFNQYLGEDKKIIRVMPNTPILVGEAASVLAPGKHVTQEELSLGMDIFKKLGLAITLEEDLLDAVTGMSGSGPAYIFMVIDALAAGGVKVGIPRATSEKLAVQTVLGAAKILKETGEHPSRMRDMVTSPGGTAIAGVHTLEQGKLRATIMDAVEAATNRSMEFSDYQ